MRKVFALFMFVTLLLTGCAEVGQEFAEGFSEGFAGQSESSVESIEGEEIQEAPEEGSKSVREPNHLVIATNVEYSIEQIIGKDIKISTREKDWIINQSGLYYGTKSTVELDGNSVEIVCHIEFDDDSYESWKIKWLVIGDETVIEKQ